MDAPLSKKNSAKKGFLVIVAYVVYFTALSLQLHQLLTLIGEKMVIKASSMEGLDNTFKAEVYSPSINFHGKLLFSTTAFDALKNNLAWKG